MCEEELLDAIKFVLNAIKSGERTSTQTKAVKNLYGIYAQTIIQDDKLIEHIKKLLYAKT